MANADIPRGLVPVRHVSSAPLNGGVNLYSVPSSDATAIFVGDPVKLVGTSQTINNQVYSDVAQAATGDVIVGVVVGIQPDTRDTALSRAASTAALLYVTDDPDGLFEIQESSGGTPFTANDIGLNANFVVAAGSSYTGYSAVKLNNASEATTNTLDLKIIGFMPRADNEIGANAKWLVKINRHAYSNQVAGV
jgi:hypothetical protein